MKLAAIALLFAATGAFAQTTGLYTLSCTSATDTDLGTVIFNSVNNVVSIQGNNWNVLPDGSGIISSGQLGVAGPYLRMNRFNGVVMARWRPTTPAGAVDFAGVCDVRTRKF